MFVVTAAQLTNMDLNVFSETMLMEQITKAMNPIEWWKSANTEKLPVGFQDFTLTLFILPSSTGSLERSFSTLGNILTHKRNRLGITKASQLCTINQYLHINQNRKHDRPKRRWFDCLSSDDDDN